MALLYSHQNFEGLLNGSNSPSGKGPAHSLSCTSTEIFYLSNPPRKFFLGATINAESTGAIRLIVSHRFLQFFAFRKLQFFCKDDIFAHLPPLPTPAHTKAPTGMKNMFYDRFLVLNRLVISVWSYLGSFRLILVGKVFDFSDFEFFACGATHAYPSYKRPPKRP